ncbi:pilus assembly protein PilP [Leeia sp. TBRC 13508]|uniref:Pilus assembly protein PilP n=1 Tax=Leeia speluncae TaxID=2884804 RepID=A0ABS8D2Y4_9NEIS|nr:pilus assembly protein PilP [Leeia speluncae]MCB6182550.1 pilus assembly protein PilP [Leeia speluncae]
MKNRARYGLIVSTLALLLSACGNSGTEDLDEWMSTEGASIRSRIDPVPALEPYVPFAYQAYDLPDPFSVTKVQQNKGKGINSPDPNWKKEALEEFDLDKLNMVGTLNNKKEGVTALIQSPSKDIFKAKIGNHIGRNFGVITNIDESSISIKELIEDSNGDWSERSASLKLVEQEQK